MSNTHSKQGGIMLIVLVVLIALSTLSVGLFKLAERDGVEAIYAMSKEQAFWLAESGLQKNLEKILTNKTYRDSVAEGRVNALYETDSMAVDDSGVAGLCETYTWKTGVNDYMIEVHANVRGMKRRLQLSAENVRYDLPYVLSTRNGNARIKGGTTINGDLSVWGDLAFFAGVVAPGKLYAKRFSAFGVYDFTPLTSLDPLGFVFDIYDGELMDAANGTPMAGSVHSGNLSGDVDLTTYADNALYVSGNVSITQKITGPGKLVVNGAVGFAQNYTLGSDVQIITRGNFDAMKEGTLGTNVNIFAKGSGNFDKATSGGGGSSAMVFLGALNVDREFVYSGLVYTGGSANFKATSKITGAILTDSWFDIDQNSVLTYDADAISEWLLYSFFKGQRFTSDNEWNELPLL